MRVVCSKACAAPRRDPAQAHPGICVCGGYLDDVLEPGDPIWYDLGRGRTKLSGVVRRVTARRVVIDVEGHSHPRNTVRRHLTWRKAGT